jgi:hypothetical protein
MVVRMKLVIEQDEYSALLRLALAELRNPESQVHFILRKELKRKRLITEKIKASDFRNAQSQMIQGVDNGSK